MIIPNNIDRNESKGEIIVFNKFKSENSDLIVLHSVFLHNHVKNLSGEIDFLVLAPNRGVFCLELKHGPVSRKSGKWFYKNNMSHKGPFRQATDAMHSLRNWMLDRSSGKRKERLNKILFGTGVIFSGITTRIDLGLEGEQWQVLYRDALINNKMSNYIDSLSKNWHQKQEDQYWYDINFSRPTVKDCEYILKLLRNDFDREYTTLNALLDTETTIQSFTEEQLKILDHTLYNDRCLIEGYAGTGKTVLAMELFKTYLEKGMKVGFYCYNRRLADTIENKIKKVFSSAQLEGSYVGSLHSYLIKATSLTIPKENIEEFFNYKLPMEFLLAQEANQLELFDLIILDEAQDLLSENNLMVMDHFLNGGLKNGKWMILGDFLYQNLYNEKIDFIELLKSYAHYTRLRPLTINCRNTKRISEQNNQLTGVEYNNEQSQQISGEKPDIQFIDPIEESSVVSDIIKEYLNQNVPLSQIVILSPYQYENSSIQDNNYLDKLIANNKLEYSTIHSFKGLEKNIVIICGIEDLESDKAQSLLYTGISRAKARLHLLVNKSLKKNYQKIIVKNLT